MNQEKYLTIKELAEILQLKEITLRRMVWKDEIPYHRIGRSIRFKLSEVNEHSKRGAKIDDQE